MTSQQKCTCGPTAVHPSPMQGWGCGWESTALGAGTGVVGRCGAGTELLTVVSQPASSHFISFRHLPVDPSPEKEGERGHRSSFIL